MYIQISKGVWGRAPRFSRLAPPIFGPKAASEHPQSTGKQIYFPYQPVPRIRQNPVFSRFLRPISLLSANFLIRRIQRTSFPPTMGFVKKLS